ncbi:MAG: type VI secretion system baseplate subunit TssK [bacterium]|nr:type VI secretion system baseplate subunit TssK [bacterium]
MARDTIEKLLGVNWYDGLLVNEMHFSHADQRSSQLFAEAHRIHTRQPGIVDIDTSVGVGMQPIEIKEINHLEQTVGITFKLPRTIKAVTPNGQLLIGVESGTKRLGWPVPHLKIVHKKEGFPPGEYVVAARPDVRRGLKVDYQIGRILQQEGVATAAEEIELAYPAVALDLVEVSQYKSNIDGSYGDYVALGLLENAGAEIRLREDFVPPVLRLDHARAFGADIDGLSKLLDSLVQEVSRKLAGQAKALAASFDGDLMFTAMDILSLRTFLLTKLGLIQNLPQISSSTLFLELMYPLAEWHERLFARAFGEENLPRFYARRPDIKGLTWEDLCVNTAPLIDRSIEQLQQIIEDID